MWRPPFLWDAHSRTAPREGSAVGGRGAGGGAGVCGLVCVSGRPEGRPGLEWPERGLQGPVRARKTTGPYATG